MRTFISSILLLAPGGDPGPYEPQDFQTGARAWPEQKIHKPGIFLHIYSPWIHTSFQKDRGTEAMFIAGNHTIV
jgi:hypothetical protein